MAQKPHTPFRAGEGNPFHREQPEEGSVRERRHAAGRGHCPGHATSGPRLRGTWRMGALLASHFKVCSTCLTVHSAEKNAARAPEKASPHSPGRSPVPKPKSKVFSLDPKIEKNKGGNMDDHVKLFKREWRLHSSLVQASSAFKTYSSLKHVMFAGSTPPWVERGHKSAEKGYSPLCPRL